jgi:anti-anti-sigma regulatory factor
MTHIREREPQTETTPNTRRIELNGEYDVSQMESAASSFRALRPDGPLAIDLTKCTLVDSTFLNELIKLGRRYKEHPITLLGESGGVMHVFRIVHFSTLFESPE